MLLTVGAFVVVLGVLIFVHELGHFMTAKWVGIGVPRFSIGLGPVTPLSFRRGETEYVISWIPFGGYVKMATEEEEAADVLEGGEAAQTFPPEKLFENKPLWARILVISAGVIMNVIFAWVVYVFLATAYGRSEDPTTEIGTVAVNRLPPGAESLGDVPFGAQIIRINGDTITSLDDAVSQFMDITTPELRIEFANAQTATVAIDGIDTERRAEAFSALSWRHLALVGSVEAGSPASRAGFEAGDQVVGINGDTIRSWTEMVAVIEESAGEELGVAVLRGGEVVELQAVPEARSVPDPETGEERERGRLGIGSNLPVRHVRIGFGGALVYAGRQVGRDAGNIWFVLTSMMTGKISPKELGGPVLIGQLSGQTARMGFDVFLSFMALFSINLAILNILPIPVLDGGHLVFLLLEGVRGRPLSRNLRMKLTQVGLAVLLGIIVLAMTNDILRLFR